MDEYNKDELDAPCWLDEAFFSNVLIKSQNDDSITIKEVKITPATVKGDHFASVMFRATVEYDTDKSKSNVKSLIVKILPEVEGFKKEAIGESYIFETEICMYSKVLPKFEAELRKIGDKTVLSSKAVDYSLETRKYIIFEDLVEQGYVTERSRLANLVESKAAFLKLAKWHAVSYKLASEGDTTITDLREGLFNMKGMSEMPFISTGMDFFIDKISEFDELKEFIPKLRSAQKQIVEKSFDSANSYRKPGAKGIFVLCHGDFHVKNMMFKRTKQGELEDVMLLDFQLSSFAPAVLDILYGLYILATEEVRRNHRDELVYYYASNFIKTLEELGFKGESPKVSDFLIEMLNHRHFELFLFTTFLPMSYVFNSGHDPERIMASDEVRRDIYNCKDYIEDVKRHLPRLFYQGFME